jgi:N-acetylneuraminic acid mutarotase
VWTGSEMIVWGGTTNNGVADTGAAYNHTTDTWRLIATPPVTLSSRSNHTAIWTGPTGIAMVVWGGQDGAGNLLNDGGRYDPATDSWRTTDLTINVPTERFDHTAVWTGSKMIVWGGNDSTFTNTGGRYTP